MLCQYFPGCYILYFSQELNIHDSRLRAVVLIGASNAKFFSLDCAVFVHLTLRVVPIPEVVHGITY